MSRGFSFFHTIWRVEWRTSNHHQGRYRLLWRNSCNNVSAYPNTTPAEIIHWKPLSPNKSVNVTWNCVSITKRKVLRASGPGIAAQSLANWSIRAKILFIARVVSCITPNAPPNKIPKINSPAGRINICAVITVSYSSFFAVPAVERLRMKRFLFASSVFADRTMLCKNDYSFIFINNFYVFLY